MSASSRFLPSSRQLLLLLGVSCLIIALIGVYRLQPVPSLVVEILPSLERNDSAPEMSYCRAACVKDKNDRLLEVVDVRSLDVLPLPKCSRIDPNVDPQAYAEWQTKPLCATPCAKDQMGNVSSVNISLDDLPFCSRRKLDFYFHYNRANYSAEDTFWPRTENFAAGCNEVHGLHNQTLYRSLDHVGIHLVYFTWLPKNKNARRVVPEQLYDVQRSGLFDRPNTFLHIVANTDVDAEFNWLQDQPLVKKYATTVTRTKKNRYEFAGMRMMWELGCRAQAENRPNDLFVYFHAKGTTYNMGRTGIEMAMTNEIVASWKHVLNLIAANPGALTFGLGGPGFHWITFFWARAELFMSAPMPVITHSRYWYEFWAGYDLRKEFPDRFNTSQCHLATGIDSVAQLADSDFKPKDVKEIPNDRGNRTFDNFRPEHLLKGSRTPQYSLPRCGMIEVTSLAIQRWWRPTQSRLDKFIKESRKFLADSLTIAPPTATP